MAQRQPIQEPSLKSDKDNSIYVPILGLSITKQKTLFGKNWHQQKTRLHQQSFRMPTLYENAQFLKHLHDNLDNPEYRQIFDEITQIRDPWRGEYFDSYFTTETKQMYMTYNIFDNNGLIKEVTEPLEDCLMEDTKIDLAHYLVNHTRQGLPKKDTKKGNLFYLYPRDNSVARFRASSDWADLDCYWDPGDSSAGLGVRAVSAVAPVAPAQNISSPSLEQIIESLRKLEGEHIPSSAFPYIRKRLKQDLK